MLCLHVVRVNDLDLLNANHVLRQKCHTIDISASQELKRAQLIIREMYRTLYADSAGVALAAPQVGILSSIITIDYEDRNTKERKLLALINPIISSYSEEINEDLEICLSLPGYSGSVPRSNVVVIEGLDQFGKATTIEADGFLARVLQHEIDHLTGILYIDKVINGLNQIQDYPDRRTKATLKSLELPDP